MDVSSVESSIARKTRREGLKQPSSPTSTLLEETVERCSVQLGPIMIQRHHIESNTECTRAEIDRIAVSPHHKSCAPAYSGKKHLQFGVNSTNSHVLGTFCQGLSQVFEHSRSVCWSQDLIRLASVHWGKPDVVIASANTQKGHFRE